MRCYDQIWCYDQIYARMIILRAIATTMRCYDQIWCYDQIYARMIILRASSSHSIYFYLSIIMDVWDITIKSFLNKTRTIRINRCYYRNQRLHELCYTWNTFFVKSALVISQTSVSFPFNIVHVIREVPSNYNKRISLSRFVFTARNPVIP